MRGKAILLTLTIGSIAVGLAGCGDSSTNVNVRTANTANVNRAPTPTTAPTVDCNNANMTREEYNKNRAACENQKGSSTIGSGVNDSWIWFKTRMALLAASDLRESTINVDVANDVITLKGTVANAAQKASSAVVSSPLAKASMPTGPV